MNELIEILRGMADMLDGPQNAGNLVVPAIIQRFRESADIMERLETENASQCKQLAEKEKIVNAYAQSARVIALHLDRFCDRSLPYADMIADAVRTVNLELTEKNKEIERLMDNLQKQDDAALAELQRRQNKITQWRRTSEENFATCEKLNHELARVTAERDAAIAEIERYTGCHTCKTEDCYKRKGRENCHWQWRGPQKEDGGNDSL